MFVIYYVFVMKRVTRKILIIKYLKILNYGIFRMKKTVSPFFVSFQTNLMMLSYTYNVTSVYGRIYIENQCLIEYPPPPLQEEAKTVTHLF